MKLRVGSWPGYGDRHNQFIDQFLKGLEIAGCAVTSLETIDDFPKTNLDVIVLHWAERVFFEAENRGDIPIRITRFLRLLRSLSPRTKVVWIVHNLQPHDPGRLQKLIWPYYTAALARRVDGALTLSPGTIAPVKEAFVGLRSKPVSYFWHPTYPNARLPADEACAVRRKHGFGEGVRVLGYCGQIRPYKGVEQLLDTFLETDSDDLRLLVAGLPQDPGLEDRLKAAAVRDPRIKLGLRDLTATEFREFLHCCDVIVAPFRQYLHSGSLIHSLSAGRAILTPRTAFSQSLLNQLGGDWVRLYEGELTAELLQLDDKTVAAVGKPDLAAFAPDIVGVSVTEFLREIVTNQASLVITP